MDKPIDYKKSRTAVKPFERKAGRKKNDQILPTKQNIIFKSIAEIKLTDHSFIMEIGMENNTHLPFLLQKAKGISYHGIQFSDQPATLGSFNQTLATNGAHTEFNTLKTNEQLKFANNYFDYCLNLNSIYFWTDPQFIFHEIYRVLRPEGTFSIAFIEQHHGKDLPWTQASFNFYDTQQLKSFFRIAGFLNIEVKDMNERLMAADGKQSFRPFILISGKK